MSSTNVDCRFRTRGLRPLLRRRCRSPDPTDYGFSIPMVIAEEVLGEQELYGNQWVEEELAFPRGPPLLQRRRSRTPDPASVSPRRSPRSSPKSTPTLERGNSSFGSFLSPKLSEPKLVLLVLTEYFTNFFKVQHIKELAPNVKFHLLTAEPPKPFLDISTLVEYTMRIPNNLLVNRDEDDLFDSCMLALKGVSFKYEGVFTFGEDDVCLTARVANVLGTWSLPLPAARAGRNKFLARQRMQRAGAPCCRFAVIPPPLEGSGKRDLSGIRHVPFPAVLKPVGGAASVAVKVVKSEEDIVNHFGSLPDTFIARGPFVLEEYLRGEEVDVDMILWRGKLLWSNVVDNVMSGMSEIEQILPSQKSKEVCERLVDCAHKCVLALVDKECCGVFHSELKWDPETGKLGLIEINCRVGGGPMYNTVEWMYGNQQSLLLATLLISLKINPAHASEWLAANGVKQTQPHPNTVVIHSFLSAHRPGLTIPSVTLVNAFVEQEPSLLLMRQVGQTGEPLTYPPASEDDEYGWICVQGNTEEDARVQQKRVIESWVEFWENSLKST